MLDLDALSQALDAREKLVRIVIADHKGSTPRETGTAMLVFAEGSSGTIGGGNLEYQAMARAREMLSQGPDLALHRQALGPSLKQCCGGAVTLVSEVFTPASLAAMLQDPASGGVWARPVEPGAGALPNSVANAIKRAQDTGGQIRTQLSGGWLVEPIAQARQPVFIYGAGHVGTALAKVLAPLERFAVNLVDLRPDRFDGLPETISQSCEIQPTDVMAAAGPRAIHIIMTPEHDYDLELCHHVLKQDFALAGLIGSETKWARFRNRLSALGHSETDINRISCPIGNPSLGKHPQAIAIGIAAALLTGRMAE